MYPQRVGRQKHVLDIDIHFNDGPRGGLNRRRGRPRTQRTWNGPNNAVPAEGSNGNAVEAEPSVGYTPTNSGPNPNTDRRRNNQQSYRNRNDRGPRRDFYVNKFLFFSHPPPIPPDPLSLSNIRPPPRSNHGCLQATHTNSGVDSCGQYTNVVC